MQLLDDPDAATRRPHRINAFSQRCVLRKTVSEAPPPAKTGLIALNKYAAPDCAIALLEAAKKLIFPSIIACFRVEFGLAEGACLVYLWPH